MIAYCSMFSSSSCSAFGTLDRTLSCHRGICGPFAFGGLIHVSVLSSKISLNNSFVFFSFGLILLAHDCAMLCSDSIALVIGEMSSIFLFACGLYV